MCMFFRLTYNKMPIYITAVASGSGLPIFSKSKGNVKNLPFTLIGSLNGVHMFGKSHNLVLLRTNTQEYKVAWKEFHNSIVLIGISSSCTDATLNKLLESVFSAMVLIVGVELVKSQRNIERLKRELKMCYPLIERLMDSLNCNDSNNKNPSELIGMTEVIMCPENHLIQIVLDTYSECVDSMYSCVLISGKIAVATESWWSLHPDEIKLLSLLAADGNTSNKDIPVYLPHKSPAGACRFVVCTLVPNVLVCSLCGSNPSLTEIENSASQCFRNAQEILTSAVQCSPRNFTNCTQLDPGILGLLLINMKLNKYLFSSLQQNSSKRANNSHRLDILKTFCYEAVWGFLISEGNEGGKETYWCSEYHKCHAAVVDDDILCVLYNSSVPTYSMRLITRKTLKILISDKQACW